MKVKENPIFLSKNKKIQLIKNISVNLKCIKSQKIKLDNKMNQNLSNKNNNNNDLNKKTLNNNKIQKNVNIINIKKLPTTNKMNNQKRCKSTKSLSVNNSNKSYIKHNFIIKRNEKSLKSNKSYIKTTTNTKHKKNEFYKKINLTKINNNVILIKNNNINNLSPINRPKKLIQNNAEINQNNPMELTFGSSSFMSNNLQTETNETDKDKVSIKVNNKIKKKNNSFFVSINSKKDLKDKNVTNINNNIRPNKILKLNKKLILKQSWKIRPTHIKYKPSKSVHNKEKENEKNKEDRNNKSAFIIHNYSTKSKYNNNKNNTMNNTHIDTNNNKNNISSIKNKKNSIKENKNIRNSKLVLQEKKLKSKFITFYKKNLLRNKIFKMKKEVKSKNNYENKKILIKNYSLNDSSFYENNRFKSNITQINNNKFSETNECIIKINKSVDKSNGKFKLIIKRANKVIKRMPKSTPKLLLTHPSFKNLFF